MNQVILWSQRQRFSWREFLILVAIGTLANLYFLTSYSPSIDDEMASMRSSSEIWIAQGRFTIYLVETFLFPQPALPFSPYILLNVLLALSQMLLVRAHGIVPGWRSYAAYCLFATYPTWWLIEEFAANVPSTGIGFLLTCAALMLLSERPANSSQRVMRSEIVRLFLIGLFLAFGAGAYQTLLLLFMCCVLGITLFRSIKTASVTVWRQVCFQLIYGAVCVATGAVMYFAINKLALAAADVKPQYIGEFFRLDLLSVPRWLAWSIATRAWNIYSGSATLFGASMPMAFAAILCAFVATILARPPRALSNLLLFVMLLGVPFILNVFTGPFSLPLRAFIALPYVIWLCAVLTFSIRRASLFILGLGVFGLFQLQILNLTSQYIVSANLTQQQDGFMGLSIGSRIQQLKGHDSQDETIWLDTFGHGRSSYSSVFASAELSATKGSFFGWDNGNIVRIVSYLRGLGFNNIRAVPSEVRAQLTPQFERMPVWPQDGSLVRSGKYYLLKLGEKPDAAHDSSKKIERE